MGNRVAQRGTDFDTFYIVHDDDGVAVGTPHDGKTVLTVWQSPQAAAQCCRHHPNFDGMNVKELTLPALVAIAKDWRDNPPYHSVVAFVPDAGVKGDGEMTMAITPIDALINHPGGGISGLIDGAHRARFRWN